MCGGDKPSGKRSQPRRTTRWLGQHALMYRCWHRLQAKRAVGEERCLQRQCGFATLVGSGLAERATCVICVGSNRCKMYEHRARTCFGRTGV
jgi:hypothetical protein